MKNGKKVPGSYPFSAVEKKLPLLFSAVFVLCTLFVSLSCTAVKPASAAPPRPAKTSAAASAKAGAHKVASVRTNKKAGLSGCAMLGNSFVEDLNVLGLLPKMDMYDRIGLTVKTVFTLSPAKGGGPVINGLNKKSYRSVYLLFGENELGWPGNKRFIKNYGKVIDAVRARQPGAKIYIQSIFPVSASASAKNTYGINNKRIRQYNKMLRALAAQKNAVYLDIASVVADSKGNLPNGASADGVHPNKKYCKMWVNYLKTHQ